MKRYICTLLLISVTQVFSQTCGTGNFTLTTQAEVDTFVATYSGSCDTVNSLYIIGADITDLSGVNFLTTVVSYLRIVNNPLLTNLNGLQNLTTIGSFLDIRYNASLTTLSALSNLVSVSSYIFVESNPNIVNLSGFEGLTSLGGGTTSSIRIIGNNSLVSLEGLNNIERAPKSVVILSNPVLTDISALETLNLVGSEFTLQANPQLNDCCILDDIRTGQLSILGAITINNNAVNCSSLYDIVLSCSTSRLDTDSDTILDSEDNCVNTANTAQIDSDSDGVGDVCDNCPNVANATQIDTNNNGIGDVCENDVGLNTGSDNGGVGIGTTNPHSILEIADGDIFLNNPYRGVILKSQDGKCYRYQVNSSGQLIGKEITCPDN